MTDSVHVLPPGWEIRRVWLHHTHSMSEESRLERVDTESGLRYQNDSLPLLADKCAAIFLGGHFYGYAYVLWHMVRAPLVALTIAVEAIWAAIRRPTWNQTVHLFAAVLWKAPCAFLENVWAILRAPFYATAMEFAGLYGFFVSPVKGCVLIGNIEKSWHHKIRRQDQTHSSETFSRKIWRGLSDPDNPNTFFFAYCMQPLGSLNDPNVIRSEIILRD